MVTAVVISYIPNLMLLMAHALSDSTYLSDLKPNATFPGWFVLTAYHVPVPFHQSTPLRCDYTPVCGIFLVDLAGAMPGFAQACIPLLVCVARRKQMTKVTGLSYFASIMQKFSALKLSKI